MNYIFIRCIRPIYVSFPGIIRIWNQNWVSAVALDWVVRGNDVEGSNRHGTDIVLHVDTHIQLLNKSSSHPLSLLGPSLPTNTWHVAPNGAFLHPGPFGKENEKVG